MRLSLVENSRRRSRKKESVKPVFSTPTSAWNVEKAALDDEGEQRAAGGGGGYMRDGQKKAGET